jgi:hypothetical protein
MRRRLVLFVLVAATVAAGVLSALIAWQLRPNTLRDRLTSTLSSRLNVDASVENLQVVFAPWLRVSGAGLTLRVRNRPDLPPFVSIAHFSVDLGVISIVRRHVDTVHVDGLTIRVPPSEARDSLGGGPDNGPPSAIAQVISPSKVIIEHLITHDAMLSFVSRTEENRPLDFLIRDLELEGLGFERPVAFHAHLVNPVPRGLVDADGTFGPWTKDDVGRLPLSGKYVLSEADLATFNGIAGILKSTGTFGGRLTAIAVSGTTTTPEFNLSLGGTPQPLSTSFDAVVDGTNGTTVLRRVDATLGKTAMSVRGAITNLPGPGFSIDLTVSIPKGPVATLVALTVAPPNPLPTGSVTLQCVLHLPPGDAPVLTRLAVRGSFSLSGIKFTKSIQDQVQAFSVRTQAKNETAETDVSTSAKGKFGLNGGAFHLQGGAVDIPGATVTLDGSCNLRDRSLALRGHLRMDATISKAVGGVRSIFLWPFNPFFRKRGQGTVLPIKIGGTIDSPKVGLNLFGSSG